MDPNETLRQLRQLFADIDENVWHPDFEEARDLFQSLDRWICDGGFLPEGWQR